MAEVNRTTVAPGHARAREWVPSAERKQLGSRVEALDKALKTKGLAGRRPYVTRAETVLPGGTPAPVMESRSHWQELKEQAVMAFESGLLPRFVDSRQKAITIALMGREFGLSPMQALCGIYVVNGMAALRGSLMLRLIYERVSGAAITVLTPPEKASLECEVEMKRPGGKPHVFRFTLEDARKAGFMNKPIWQQHTATMLRWAAIRTGARVVFADAIAGAYMEDEIPAEAIQDTPQDIPMAPEIPAVSVQPPSPSARAASVVTKAMEETCRPASVQAAVAPIPVPAPARVEVRALPLHKPVSEKQMNRLYAIAHGKHWSRQDVGVWMEKWFHKRDPKALSRVEYDRLCNFLLSNPPKPEKSQPVG